MKKTYLWMAAMASLLSFTACSEDASPLDNGQNPGEVTIDDGATIELALSNTGIGTRAARPMGSSAAANNVNKVQLKFYTSLDQGVNWTEATDVSIQKITGVKNPIKTPKFDGNVITFNDTIHEAGNKTGTHIEESYKVKLTGLNSGTSYRIVAYGYNGDNFPYAEQTAPTKALNADAKGVFSTADNHGKEGYSLEEVFAGYKDAATKTVEGAAKGQGKFTSTPKITISRQVAGILAYFKIPTKVNKKGTGELTVVKTVKVVANNKTAGFKFPNTLLENKSFNGITPSNTEDVLMEFDMSTAAVNWSNGNPTDEYYKTRNDDLDEDVVINSATGIATGYQKPTKLVLKANTFFGARYILPYDAHVATKDAKTLRVIMYDATGAALKTLNIVTNQVPSDGSRYNYDIRCNNFYSIGKKYASGNTTGTPDPDPENPDPKPEPEGPDEPIDLGATDQITVEINDAWEVLHDMDAEEE